MPSCHSTVSLRTLFLALLSTAFLVLLAISGLSQPAVAQQQAQQTQQKAQPSVIQDCDTCPVMVVVPAGSFVMGSTEEERTREKVPAPPKVPFDFAKFEQPRREVVFEKPFAIGKYEVSRGEYARFVADTDFPNAGPGIPPATITTKWRAGLCKRANLGVTPGFHKPIITRWCVWISPK